MGRCVVLFMWGLRGRLDGRRVEKSGPPRNIIRGRLFLQQVNRTPEKSRRTRRLALRYRGRRTSLKAGHYKTTMRRSGGGDGFLEAMEEVLVFVAEASGEAVAELGEKFAGVGEVEFPVLGVNAE
jgi:hypothetical protein